ncbi:hypothetical protein [Mangrovihabitans endophyticus]|uniref:Uncharacterized protein n=1 Tax=Mangrovihabitans endophyticus TaxID=1751298 RepID=A0A8J3C7R5_9ACTN|nr:hypothetical protein [Mangrovihabitans endophyticus]GGL17768.1 hypothetical protein GCM10012284_60490 [Mangrovihabitans endophyticus]
MTTVTATPTTTAATAVVPGAELSILLAEYGALKDEQQKRIDRRDHLVYGTLTAVAATLAAAGKLPAALLLLPVVTVVLGWTHLVTDLKVATAGRYLRDDLSVRLSALAGAPVLGWETAHRADDRRRQRRGLQLAVDLATFPCPGLVSVGAYLSLGHPPVLGWLAALLLGAAALVLAGQQALYAADGRRLRLRIGGRR